VALSAEGRGQVRRLATRLQSIAIAGVFSSPVQRALETATMIASVLRLAPQVDAALDEVAFGTWQGRTFDDLSSDPHWRQFNQFRTTTLMPGGGSLLQVQARVTGWMAAQAFARPDATVIAVSHADVIRAAVAACLGISLDLALRLEIAPASVSEVQMNEHALIVRRLNDTAHLEPA
jgi:ribonuclease H / adenosylcobalamin/alpha-ribazole phosphatase